MKRLEYFAIGSILVLAILSVGFGTRSASAQTGSGTPEAGGTFPRTITVSGQGEAEAQPDQALVQLGVENQAKTAGEALTANSTQMQGLLNALEQAGVAAADIQTQQVMLNPVYSNPGQAGGTPELTGYTAVNVVQVRVRDLDTLGQLLDSAVQAGGNRVQGIQFEVSDMSQVEAQAREAAWNDAEAKAQHLADLAGGGLGDVLSISETSVVPPRPFMAAGIAAPQAAAVPVQPGTQTVQSTLQVVWALGSPVPPGAAAGTPGAVSTSAIVTSTATLTATPTAIATPAIPAGTATTEATPLMSPTSGAPGTSGAARTPIAAPPSPAGTATSEMAPLAVPTSGAPGTSGAARTPIAAPPGAAGTGTPEAAPLAGPTSGAPGTSGPASTPIAAPAGTQAPIESGTTAQAGIMDPFNYCATVGTIDAPDARYTGPVLPSAIVDGLQAALNLPGTPAPPVAQNSFWRCMNGKVYACTVGANLPCQEKANTSRQPTAEMQQFCTAQPDAAVIPAAVAGHNTIYAWRCSGGTPQIIRQIAQVDAQGFIADIWYEIPPGYQ